MNYNRIDISKLIAERLTAKTASLQQQFLESKDKIGYFFVDDLLPEELALAIHTNFPKLSETKAKKDLREYKYIAYQMDKYHKLLEEVIYAFQEKNVVDAISKITNLPRLLPDENLYAGGLSLMAKDNYLNPHLDNSHDKDRKLWRVLNLLYYVTPNWKTSNGGNLEVWPNGIKENPIEITSKFNRLAIMATHNYSWHSVNKVQVDGVRCCVSNYYFSETPLLKEDSFHVTLFRGRREEKGKDLLLKLDNSVRSGVRKLFKNGVRENPHKYKK